MARDFIFRVKPGQPLPPADPNGYRVLLDETTGLFKLLNSDGGVVEAPGISTTQGRPDVEIEETISSAQILSLGNGVELNGGKLMEAGYYGVLKYIYLELNHGGSDYSIGTLKSFTLYLGNTQYALNLSVLAERDDVVAIGSTSAPEVSVPSDGSLTEAKLIVGGGGIGESPTGGNGTLRVKLGYDLVKFG
jgi:hypothetical protein